MSHSPLRYLLKASVSRSLKAKMGHHSDQGGVWQEVARQQEALGAASPTGAMMDTYATYQERIDQFRSQLKYVEGCTGMAVAVGPKLVSFDVFDKPATCQKVWDRLLSGFVLDALEARGAGGQAAKADVEKMLTES